MVNTPFAKYAFSMTFTTVYTSPNIQVTALVALALAALTISTIDNNNTLSVIEGLDSSLASALFLDELQGVIKNTKGICGFLIFVAVVTLVVESLSTIARFTTSLSKRLLRIFHIAVSIITNCNSPVML